MKTTTCISLLSLALVSSSQAATVEFDLLGKAGSGLLPGNENHVPTGDTGKGGEFGAGISYDTTSNVLAINIRWGGEFIGFENLTGNATAGHIHGPTASGGTGSFTQNASVKYGLDSLMGWDNDAFAGGFQGTVNILEADEAALLNGQFYINVHTSMNIGGEIRGNLVAVPEPGTMALVAAGLGVLAMSARRRMTR